MSHIYILSGIPGSGKSTWARKFLKASPDTVVVSRDELRKSMYGYTEETVGEYYKDIPGLRLGQKESLISKEFDSLVRRAIRMGKSVIVDNTHVKFSYIKHYTKFSATLSMEYFNVDFDVAIKRDASRAREVGHEVIQKMHGAYVNLDRAKVQDALNEHNTTVQAYIFNDETKPHCVVYDIDGTLAHDTHRNCYDYTKVGSDDPDPAIVNLCLSTDEHDTEVFVVSGRDDCCKDDTRKWLNDQDIYPTDLIMRKTGDVRPDWIIKQEIWNKICDTHYIELMVDDRDQVVDRARQLGFKVAQVALGDF